MRDHMAFFVLAAIVLLAASTAVSGVLITGQRDVCVLGGGAAGMAAAVFAKDKGLSVVVIESDAQVGGQCNTLQFVPPAQGLPNYIDVGVQFFADTAAANASGLGPWSIDAAAIVRRFAGANSVYPLNFATDTTPNFVVDLAAGIGVPPQNATPESPAFYQAYATLMGILYSYPWIDRADVPSPVPADLLLPFTDFITKYGLEPLVDSVFVPQLYAGGLGSFDKLTTLYALLNMSPTITRIFSVPDAGFTVVGGCQQVYNGMQAYLNTPQDGVLLNAQTLVALRPQASLRGSRAVIAGSLSNSKGVATGAFTYTCGKIVVAYPQTSASMQPLLPDAIERSLFSQVDVRYYFTGTLSATGGAAAQAGAFNMLNFDLLSQSAINVPALPSITQLTRGLPYGPIQFKASSDGAMTVSAMKSVVAAQLQQGMPAWLLSNVSVTDIILHRFQPHFSNAQLARAGGAYAALDALQGYRNTYYVGSLGHFAVSYQLWNAAYELVRDRF